jgi:hypothetical protein
MLIEYQGRSSNLSFPSLSGSDINQLPVVSNGRLEGAFSRAPVLRFLQTHAELHGD